MDFWENKVYLECQHRDSTGTLNHCETLGSGLKDKCLRWGGKGFLFKPLGLVWWGAIRFLSSRSGLYENSSRAPFCDPSAPSWGWRLCQHAMTTDICLWGADCPVSGPTTLVFVIPGDPDQKGIGACITHNLVHAHDLSS